MHQALCWGQREEVCLRHSPLLPWGAPGAGPEEGHPPWGRDLSEHYSPARGLKGEEASLGKERPLAQCLLLRPRGR